MTQLDQIVNGIYRISTFMEDVGISFNQYLIKDERSILIHTGSAPLFKEVSAKLWQVLASGNLAYVFISHFEADECGGLSDFLKVNAGLVPVGSAVTARQLEGFGLYGTPLIVKDGDELALGKRRLRFIAYPSEVHLREGVLAYEVNDRVLFSSDLFITRGKEETPIKKASIQEAVKIAPASIPSDAARSKCQEAIEQLDISWLAVGHGSVLDLRL